MSPDINEDVLSFLTILQENYVRPWSEQH